MGDFEFDCPYGGLGNWQEHDSVCLVCQHDIECEHEKEMAALESARRREWSRPQRRFVRPAAATTYRSAAAPLSTERKRPKRPMPVEGETPAVRLLKNMLAAGISGAGYEFGEFHRKRRLERRTNDPKLLLLMLLAGGEQVGEECGEFFEQYNFPPALPPHDEKK